MFATIARSSLLGLNTGTGRRYLDRRTGPWIPRHACLAVPDLEGAEAANLDVLLFLQRLLDGVQERINHPGTVLLRNHRTGRAGNLGGYSLDQISFRHEECL